MIVTAFPAFYSELIGGLAHSFVRNKIITYTCVIHYLCNIRQPVMFMLYATNVNLFNSDQKYFGKNFYLNANYHSRNFFLDPSTYNKNVFIHNNCKSIIFFFII